MTDLFKQECKEYANQNRLGKIEYGDNKVISCSDYLQTLSIDEACIVNNNILGAVYSKKCKFTTLNNYELTDTIYNALIGVKYADSSEEYINMGKYTIQTPKNDKTAKTGEFEGLDDLSKLEEKYTCNITDFSNATIKDVLEDLCAQSSIVLGTTTFTNEDIPITGNPFTNGETRLDVLKAILKVTLNFAYIDNDDNKLYLKWLDNEVTETLTKDDYTTLEKNNVYGPINCLVLRMSNVEGENVARQDDASISTNGENQFIIEDDYFLITEELRTKYIDNLWNKIKGFTYVDCKITSYTGKPHLRVGSKISVQDDDGSFFETYALKHNFKYDGTFYSVIESPALTKEVEKRKNLQTLKDFKKRTEAIVDKQKQQIELIAGEQTNQGQKLAKIELDTSSLKMSVSETNTALGELEKSTEEDIKELKKNLDTEVLNLQNQIDGAIQFWNGTDVPTLKNEPAINWKDETERNNHRADIYTVIINNEQGKSYRFDKVNDTWKWVEITDNELSAVKALVDQAQATANSKMTVYSQTPTLPYQVGDLWWKNGELYKCIVAKSKDETFDESDWQNSAYINQEELDELNPVDESNGTELTLKSSAGLNTVDFRIDGNSYQKTRSGKNLINVDEEYTFTRYVSIPVNLPAGTYKVLCNSVFVNDEECYDKAYIRFLNNSGSYITKNKKFTLSNDTTEIRLYANGYSYDESAGYTVVIDQLMIINDSVTDLTYEPYGVSPSPDYPSEVEVVEGYNLLDKSNIFQGSFAPTSSGIDDVVDATIRCCTKKIDIGNADNIIYQGEYFDLFSFYDANGIHISYTLSNPTIVPKDAKYVRVRFYNNANDLPVSDLQTAEVQLIKGTTAIQYLPYQNIGIQSTSKNMNTPFSYTGDFVTFKDNSVILNGTIPSNGAQFTSYSLTKKIATANYMNYMNISKINNILKAGTYTVSIEYVGGEIDNEKYLEFSYRLDKSEVTPAPIYSIGKFDIANNITKISKTFTLGKDTPFCALFGINRASERIANNFEFRVQLEKNDVATDYVPYMQTVTPLNIKGEFIGKLPNGVQDYLTVDNQGNYGIQKNVGKVVLDGSESWGTIDSKNTGTTFYSATKIIDKLKSSSLSVMCDYFSDTPDLWSNNDIVGIRLYNMESSLRFRILKTALSEVSLNGWKTWLSENNVTVYYELAEPYFVPLGKSPIKTLEGDSIIGLLSTLDTNMYCKYIRNIKSIGVFQPIGDMANYYNKYEVDSAITAEKNNILLEVNSVKATVDTDGKTLASLQKTVNLKIDDDKAQFSAINGKLENGVEKVKNTLVTIDIEGIHVETNTSKITTLITNNTFAIKNSTGDYLAFFGYDEEEKVSKAEMDNLTVKKFFKAGCHRRETFSPDGVEQRTGEFYDGGVD